MREQKGATLTVIAGPDGPTEQEIRAQLETEGFSVTGCAVTYSDQARRRRLHYAVRWHARSNETSSAPIVDRLAQQPGVQELEWRPNSMSGELQANEPPV